MEGDLGGEGSEHSRQPAGLSTSVNTFSPPLFLLLISITKESFQSMVVGLKQNENDAFFSTRYLLGPYG